MKLLAVIQITDYNEPIDSALQSVVHARLYFHSVVVVSNGGPGILSAKHKSLMEKHDIPISIVSKLTNIPDEVHAIVEIPPLCEVDTLAIEELIRHAKTVSKDDVYKTQFSLATEVVDDTQFSFAYGWLFVLYMVEWFWCAWERFRMPLDRYVRMTYIITNGTKRIVAPWQFAWRIWNTGQERTLYRPGWATIQTEPRLRGYNLVKNSIYRHELVGNTASLIGNWWLGLWWLFYWGAVVNLWVRATSLRIVYGVVHIVLSVLLYVVMSRRTSVRLDWLLALLHPLYFITFPIVVFIGRFTRPRTFWSKRKFATNKSKNG